MKLSGKTKLLAVIGDPIEHSLSPLIQNHFARELGLDYAYLAFRVQKGGCADFLASALTLPICGFNVTMPLKEEIFQLICKNSPEASEAGAVNTVVVRENSEAFGYNTDGNGFLRSLKGGIPSRVLINGGGGAAKTLVCALKAAGASVTVAVRNPSNATQIGADRVIALDGIAEACANADLFVNASPLGMAGKDVDYADFSFLTNMPKHALVYDLIYAPSQTNLLKEAEKRGLKTQNGLAHLVYQAALSFELFTGAKVPDSLAEETLLICEENA